MLHWGVGPDPPFVHVTVVESELIQLGDKDTGEPAGTVTVGAMPVSVKKAHDVDGSLLTAIWLLTDVSVTLPDPAY